VEAIVLPEEAEMGALMDLSVKSLQMQVLQKNFIVIVIFVIE
jgi:hypothetical protein